MPFVVLGLAGCVGPESPSLEPSTGEAPPTDLGTTEGTIVFSAYIIGEICEPGRAFTVLQTGANQLLELRKPAAAKSLLLEFAWTPQHPLLEELEIQYHRGEPGSTYDVVFGPSGFTHALEGDYFSSYPRLVLQAAPKMCPLGDDMASSNAAYEQEVHVRAHWFAAPDVPGDGHDGHA